MKKKIKVILAFCVCVLFFANCSSRKSASIDGDFVPKNERVAQGQVLFSTYCYKCHPGGEGGLGPATNSLAAPNWLRRFQVRHGLGTMPAFKDHEIGDKELKAIVAYVKARRHYD